MNLIGSICRTFAWSIATAAIGLTLASDAGAHEQKTKWFTIDIMPAMDATRPASDATPALFLTNTSEGVKVEGYRSGDPTQQWTPTQTDYPRAPRVVEGGENFLEGFIDCIGDWGCPFHGESPAGLRKFVNRASGACLMFKSVGSNGGVVAEPCSGADSDIPQQTWAWEWADGNLTNGAPPRQVYTPLVGKFHNQEQCLGAVSHQRPISADSALEPNNCDPGPPWFQQFRFLEATELTCTTHWFWDLCFVQGQAG